MVEWEIGRTFRLRRKGISDSVWKIIGINGENIIYTPIMPTRLPEIIHNNKKHELDNICENAEVSDDSLIKSILWGQAHERY